MFTYQRIPVREIKRGTPYSRMMLPALKERAATLLQQAWRLRQKGRSISGYNQIVSFIMEPLENEGVDSIVQAIHEHHYERLPFELDKFTLHLAKAFREEKITQEAFLTAKLMYEAYDFFHLKTMASVNRYKLLDDKGPYSPFQVNYASEAMKASIHRASASNPHLHYYTIDFPPYMAACLFYYSNTLKVSLPYLQPALIHFLENALSGEKDKPMRAYLLPKLRARQSGNLIEGYTPLIQRIILEKYPMYKDYILNQYPGEGEPGSLGMSEEAFRQNREGVSLILSIFRVNPQLPALCTPSSENRDSLSSGLSWVIPTMETQAVLHNVFHGTHQTLSQPIVGALGVKLLRAMDELPSLTSFDSLTPYQTLLKTLYGEESLSLAQSARATEITFPGVSKTSHPHDTHPHDFVLTWHDVFHADRNGCNDKSLMRHLRLVFDRRAGLARDAFDPRMPHLVWNMTDMDNPAGQMILKAMKKLNDAKSLAEKKEGLTVYYHTAAKAFYFMAENLLGFRKNSKILINDLILLDMIRQPNLWQNWLIQLPPDEFFKWSKQTHEMFYQQFKALEELVRCYPDASDGEIILRRLITPEDKPYSSLDSLFDKLHQQGIRYFVYWSLNNGLFFDPAVRALLPYGVKLKLEDNATEVLLKAFETIIDKLDTEATLSSSLVATP